MPPRSPRLPSGVASPTCPYCGCNAVDLVNAGTRWGRAWALFACEHCGEEFSLGQRPQNTTNGHPYRVPFPKLACPSCGGKRTEVTSSPAKRPGKRFKDRYHECADCGCKFASYEEE